MVFCKVVPAAYLARLYSKLTPDRPQGVSGANLVDHFFQRSRVLDRSGLNLRFFGRSNLRRDDQSLTRTDDIAPPESVPDP